MINHESVQNHYPERLRTTLPEDTFPFPPELLSSEKVKAMLVRVTDAYIFYLSAAAQWGNSDGVWHKKVHTNDVIKAMVEIYDPRLGVSLEDAVCAAIGHDIARALQAWFFNSFSDGRTQYDHASEGARMLEDSFPNDPELIQAIAEHSQFAPEHPSAILDLLRDADKIAVLRRLFEKHPFLRVFTKGASYAVTPQILQAFTEKRLAHNKDRHTPADEYIFYLAWIWDIQTPAARAVIARERIPEKIIEFVAENMRVEEDVLEALVQGVHSWRVQHGLTAELPASGPTLL